MAGVRYCCATNSTLFSTCCNVAVCDDEACCPRCGELIEPADARSRHDLALRIQMGPVRYLQHKQYVARQVANDRRLAGRK